MPYGAVRARGYEFADGGPDAAGGGGALVEDCTSDESTSLRPPVRETAVQTVPAPAAGLLGSIPGQRTTEQEGLVAVPEPAAPARSPEAVLGELDALVGLESVKREVRALTDMIEVAGAAARRA